MVVLERLVTRCAGLVGFAPVLCLFVVVVDDVVVVVGCGLCCPSSGGLGRLCSIFAYDVTEAPRAGDVMNYESWILCRCQGEAT